jgi:hypothetical protein
VVVGYQATGRESLSFGLLLASCSRWAKSVVEFLSDDYVIQKVFITFSHREGLKSRIAWFTFSSAEQQ